MLKKNLQVVCSWMMFQINKSEQFESCILHYSLPDRGAERLTVISSLRSRSRIPCAMNSPRKVSLSMIPSTNTLWNFCRVNRSLAFIATDFSQQIFSVNVIRFISDTILIILLIDIPIDKYRDWIIQSLL